jgi:hypothetical protein
MCDRFPTALHLIGLSSEAKPVISLLHCGKLRGALRLFESSSKVLTIRSERYSEEGLVGAG